MDEAFFGVVIDAAVCDARDRSGDIIHVGGVVVDLDYFGVAVFDFDVFWSGGVGVAWVAPVDVVAVLLPRLPLSADVRLIQLQKHNINVIITNIFFISFIRIQCL